MQELIDELKKMVAAGAKIRELEDNIGLSQNSLSSRLSGTVPMPESWIPKIRAFLEKPIAEPQKTQMVVPSNGKLKEVPSKERWAAIRGTMDKINKDFGAGSVMILGDSPIEPPETIPTGSLFLNEALGIGGLPKGRIVEVYGPESSGKTTLCLHIIAEAQKKGLQCLMIDAEHAFDPTYAEKIGVNVDELILSQPDYGDQGLEIADRHIVAGNIGVVVIDSVAALIPKGELEGEMGDSKMGLQARLMSQACRKMTASISKSNTLCIFINQLRATIGNPYGPSEITTGGQALKFYASIRLDVRKTAQLKDGDEAYGNRVRVKVVKNKCAAPFKNAEFDLIFGEGIDGIGEIIDAAVSKNIIQKSGSWFSCNNAKLGQGRDNVRQLLKDNPGLLKEIETKVLKP